MRGGNKEEGGAEKAASGGGDKGNKDDEPSTVPIPEKVGRGTLLVKPTPYSFQHVTRPKTQRSRPIHRVMAVLWLAYRLRAAIAPTGPLPLTLCTPCHTSLYHLPYATF